jgi:hypothetical protein
MMDMLSFAKRPSHFALSHDTMLVLPDVRFGDLDLDVVPTSTEPFGSDRKPSTVLLARERLGHVRTPKFGSDFGLLADPEALCDKACDRLLLSLDRSRGPLISFGKASLGATSSHTKETITAGGG